MQVRDASRGDVEALARLLGELGYPADLGEVEDHLGAASGDRGGVPVACVGEGCIGFASYQFVYFFEDGAPRCRITAIAVDATARRKGVGETLLRAVEERASVAGCCSIEVTSGRRPERDAAHRFYPSAGFDDGGVRHRYYVKDL